MHNDLKDKFKVELKSAFLLEMVSDICSGPKDIITMHFP